MRRLYFLVPDLETTHRVVRALKAQGVDDRHVHVVAAPGTELDDLHEATVKETSYLMPAMKKGAEYGGTMGLLVGLLALSLPGVVLAGGAMLAMGVLGAGMGACLGCLLGEDIENVHVKKYASAIAGGQLLVLVDVPEKRVGEFQALIKQHYPDAKLEDTEATSPEFPY